MSEQTGTEQTIGYAFVTRLMDTGAYENVALTFIEGHSAFQKWINEAPGDPVEAPGWQEMGGSTYYDGTVVANTFIVFMPPKGQIMQYAYKIPDYAWTGWSWAVEGQVQHIVGSGRRPSLVQKLQTWKMWAKKTGAKF